MAVPKWLPLLIMLMGDGVPASAAENVWTSLGPDGGPSYLVVVHPADSNVVYASGPGGWYKSVDAGVHWAALPAVPGFGGLGSLVVDPTTPDTLYVAVNNTGPPSGTVFKSSDGGATWRSILSGVSASIAMDPADPRTLYVGGYSEVFKTSNGGETWVGASSGFPRCCLEPKPLVDPHNADTVYAHTQFGLFRSTNGGATWSGVYTYDTPDVPRMGSVVLDPRVPDTLYAVVGRIPGQQDFLPTDVYRSTDAGATWTPLKSPLTQYPNGPYGTLVADPGSSGTLYVTTWQSVFKSGDAGASWSALELPAARAGLLTVDPNNSGTIYISTQDGLYKSVDSGLTWRRSSDGLRNRPIVDVVAAPGVPQTLYASDYSRTIKSTDGGRSWRELPLAGNLIVVDPKNAATLYAAAMFPAENSKGGVLKSTDGGVNWFSVSKGLPSGRCPLISSIAIDARNTNTLYAAYWPGGDSCVVPRAAGGLWKTTDGGENWSHIASPVAGGGFRGLTIHPNDPDFLYGWNTKALFISTDGGASWSDVDAALPDQFKRSAAADPRRPRTIYVLRESGVFKTEDAGATWKAMNSGLPSPSDYLTSLIIDPLDSDTLYVSSGDRGVFRSTDGGQNWKAANSGLTSRMVNRLAVDPNDPATIYAATWAGVFAMTSTTKD